MDKMSRFKQYSTDALHANTTIAMGPVARWTVDDWKMMPSPKSGKDDGACGVGNVGPFVVTPCQKTLYRY